MGFEPGNLRSPVFWGRDGTRAAMLAGRRRPRGPLGFFSLRPTLDTFLMICNRWLVLGFLTLGMVQADPFASAGFQKGAQVQIARYLSVARQELERGRMEPCLQAIYQVLERDHNAREGWQVLAEYARKLGDQDLELWALYRDFRLAEARGLQTAKRKELLATMAQVDPGGAQLLDLTERFSADLKKLAERYEKEGRPHGAIRVYKRLLSLDPLNEATAAAIERIASAPDPALAPHATPRDPFAGIDQSFLDEFDAQHSDWDNAAKEVREHYITITDTGYKNLIRTADAMEQVNTFYREFFGYGGAGDERTVPRITVHLFKDKDEYLKRGFSPVEWSAGHFTGSHVETFLPDTGFEGVVGTLFHEAAHQFVSLATSATGWLNEGLASFFEGTRIQANGTVVMNLPAGHRLFPLAQRMEAGWMKGPTDGIDEKGEGDPKTAPTFRILVENEYAWGPPWYAPTWGLVYFLYNFQDPWDGRFVYRKAFSEFINSSGGRIGKGAVENFEKVVLEAPSKPITKERPKDAPLLKLPKTVDELDLVWKDWILALRDRQAGKVEAAQPYLRWARFAAQAGLGAEAKEHYERALLENPLDPEALEGLAEVLVEYFEEPDRASVLLEQLLRVVEADPNADALVLAKIESRLKKLDPDRRNLTRIETALLEVAEGALLAYRDAARPRMVMEWSRRLARDFGEPRFYDLYGEMVRSFGGSVDLWDRAYNEENLDGWLYGQGVFQAKGEQVLADFGAPKPGQFDFRFLMLDRLTSGDFSLETDLEVRRNSGTFAGIVFGQKGVDDFHGAALFPGTAKEGVVDTGYADLFSSFGGAIKVWRHTPVVLEPANGQSSSSVWHRLRVDVTGVEVDVWLDGERIMTHAFAGREVLAGSFGLFVGPGQARFRNVRYLSRDPRDPAGVVERKARLEALGIGAGTPVNGSYQGLSAPFPEVQTWVQGVRSSWAEAGPVPQLLVIFSQQQNEVMPLHGWLASLAQRHQDVGLRIVSVGQCFDKATLKEYLSAHPFPGDVGLDADPEVSGGMGQTFSKYFIDRFNLPRLILIDPLGRVAWEGDPGFEKGKVLEEPYATYLDDPLEALIRDYHLAERNVWNDAWAKTGTAKLARGEVLELKELLQTANDLGTAYGPAEQSAQIVWKRLGALAADPTSTAAWLETEAGHGAAAAVESWITMMGGKLDRQQAKDFARLKNHREAKKFQTLATTMDGYVAKGVDLASKWEDWASKMETCDQAFVGPRLRSLRQRFSDGDTEAWKEELKLVSLWPAAWASERLLIP
jgi:Tfp pilus assembly protein PilF